ncbi:hypothetical protein C8J56DRAFT_911602 [Mycena floridula]|nr:hypothetical protein C8J56DRAFT_911602 [Mycena floridula]
MATNPRILSWHGRGLKLDTKSDVEALLVGVDPTLVEEIQLGGNTIGVDASIALAEFLSQTTQLKIADFSDIFTGRLISEIPLALAALCDALVDKSSLVELNLSDNAFGGRSVDPIVPFLTKNRTFQVLKLNNNGLGPAGGAVIANALLESANLSKAEGKTSSLRTVICGRNRLEDGSASAWADAFAAHGTLREIRMPQNGIRMDGITTLAKGFAKCGALEHIDLQDNTFTFEGDLGGVKVWSDSLASWPELHTLNLSDCVLSGEGEIPSLVTALAGGSNPKLRTLSLQNNNLETETFSLLAANISTHLQGLKSLELQWNDIEEDDEHLERLGTSMKKRGGKLFISDDDEEEEEEEEEEKAEEAAVDPTEAAMKDDIVAPAQVDPADELADLLGKVELSNVVIES